MHTYDAYRVCIQRSVSLKYGVLGLLAEEPLHGYEVKNRFEAMLGGTWEVNIGQVYTTLQRLERDGLVESDGSEEEGTQKGFRITDDGKAELATWLRMPPNVIAQA